MASLQPSPNTAKPTPACYPLKQPKRSLYAHRSQGTTQSIHEDGSMDSNTQPLHSAITGHSNNLGTNKTNAGPCSVGTRVKAGQAYQAKERQAAGRRVLTSFVWPRNICYWNEEQQRGAREGTLINRSLCDGHVHRARDPKLHASSIWPQAAAPHSHRAQGRRWKKKPQRRHAIQSHPCLPLPAHRSRSLQDAWAGCVPNVTRYKGLQIPSSHPAYH